MKKLFLLTSAAFLFMHCGIYAQSCGTEKEILKVLEKWNEAAQKRDTLALADMFDKSEDIMVVGSDSGEIFKGQAGVKQFTQFLFSQYSFSWDLKRVDISYNGNTAWAFTDGHMSVTGNNGTTFITPYRFTAVFVKTNNQWKWKLYNGSIPKGETQ